MGDTDGGRDDQRRPSWLAALGGPGREGGRLKRRTLRVLWVLGLVVVVGIGLMSVADILRSPSLGGSAGQVAPSLTTGVPPAGSSNSRAAAGGASTAGTGGAPGLWIGVGDLEAMVERDLERILSKIAGAGRVSVAVSFETGATYVYGYNEAQTQQTTQESDSAGGTRVVSQTSSTREVVVVPQGSGSQPVVVKVEFPPIQGVVVVAGGASDSRVKALLSQAVQVLYKVPPHRVVVIAGG